ncbi:DUF4303 domain-containing protein [Elizabethkingia anophelis]|uniref:DUF4303 domain-containing protein n=1 Tax=Elizabethkingia anophelis TaxID=1117645 RepID=UPI0038920731
MINENDILYIKYKINFETLKHKIETATKKAFLEIYEKAGSENLYAFALYSDEGAMTVCPSANSLKHLEKTPTNDITYYKLNLQNGNMKCKVQIRNLTKSVPY